MECVLPKDVWLKFKDPPQHGDTLKAHGSYKGGGGCSVPKPSSTVSLPATQSEATAPVTMGPAKWALPHSISLGPHFPWAQGAPLPSLLRPDVGDQLQQNEAHLKGSMDSTYLSIGALSQNFQQFKLGRVGLLKARFHMVTDVNLLHNAFFLQEKNDRNAYQGAPLDSSSSQVTTSWVGYGFSGLEVRAVTSQRFA